MNMKKLLEICNTVLRNEELECRIAKFVGENPPSSLVKTRQVRCFAERIMLNSFVSI